MKVVHLLHYYPPEFRGGTEVCVQTLAAAQQARGDAPQVIAGSDLRVEGGEWREHTVDGVPIHRLLRRPGENYSMDFRLPRVAEEVLARVRQLAPDVVHLHHTLNLSGDLASRLVAAGLPVVTTLHDFTLVCARHFLLRPDGQSCAEAFPLPSDRCVACVLPDFPGGQELLETETRARDRMAKEEAAAVSVALAPSRFVAERWRRSGLYDEARLVVLPHSPAPQGGGPVSTRDRTDGRLVLGSWGHLAPAKGVADLIEALRLADDPRICLHLLGESLAGSAGADHGAELKRAAEDLPVTFHGRYDTDTLRATCAGMDLAVFPSRAEETFGLVVAEARALGLPVLTSDRGALPERVGEAGTCVPAADPAALAALLTSLVDDGPRLARWRAAATDADLLSPAAHADAVASHYDHARAERASRP